MGFSTKNLTNPSKWDFTGDNETAEGIRDSLTGKTAADAAKAQQAAAEKAAADGIAYLKEGAEKGYGFIDQGTAGATEQIGLGRDQALAALLGGTQQAAGVLGSTPNRLAGLLDQGPMRVDMAADPGYQFRLQQGEQAIMRSAAARGGRLGGGTLQALLAHGQGLASQEYGNAFNRALTERGQQIGLAGGADQLDLSRNSALSGLFSQSGANAANIQSSAASALGGLLNSQGQNKANLAIGQAGSAANLGMMPVQFVGGAERARADAYGNLAGLGIAAGTRAVFG
jgi:hypothetical protein